jgi:plastocyanin
VVGPDKGLANVAIVLRTEGVKAHPKYAEPAEVSLDNKDCRFEPRMLVVQIGQPVVVKNSDEFGHNTKADFFKNTQFNVTMPAGAKQTFKFTAEETLPTIISCGIHPWMRAHLWVRKSPYHAVSDAKGAFEIADLPVGKELEFHLWQGKNLSNVAIKGVTGGKSDTKGRFKIKIKAGSNDLGDIKLSPTLFKKT